MTIPSSHVNYTRNEDLMTMTMTMKISLFYINHLNTMIRENKAEKKNVVNEQETIQNNIECRYRR